MVICHKDLAQYPIALSNHLKSIVFGLVIYETRHFGMTED